MKVSEILNAEDTIVNNIGGTCYFRNERMERAVSSEGTAFKKTKRTYYKMPGWIPNYDFKEAISKEVKFFINKLSLLENKSSDKS